MNKGRTIIVMFLIMILLSLLLMQYVTVLWTAVNTAGLEHNKFLRVLPLIGTLAFMGALFLSRRGVGALAGVFEIITYVALGFLFIWFVTVLAAIAAQLLLVAFKIAVPFRPGPWVFGLAVLFCVLSAVNAFRPPSVKNIAIKSSAVQKDVTAVQISDTHLGPGVPPYRLKKLAAQINAVNPDIIFFTGDIFEDTGAKTPEYIDIINELRPPLGKYGVLGNHEYYGGVQHNLDLWQKSSITALQNACIALPYNITLCGVNDIRASGVTVEDMTKILSAAPFGGFNILLSHTPLLFDEAAQNGINLMLSGHTNNGQIWPFKYLVRTMFKNVYGLYKTGDAYLYVTAGTFYRGPPLRFLSNNELPIIKIIKDENPA